MNLKEVLKNKSEYPVRLIATRNNHEFIDAGDELGIEIVDFSCCNLRCSNKTNDMIVEVYYNKDTWELEGDWVFKNMFFMTMKVKKLYLGALENKSFLEMIKNANNDGKPGFFADELEKHIFAATYYGWLVGMYDINWESNI